jgi:hypothetical protein
MSTFDDDLRIRPEDLQRQYEEERVRRMPFSRGAVAGSLGTYLPPLNPADKAEYDRGWRSTSGGKLPPLDRRAN